MTDIPKKWNFENEESEDLTESACTLQLELLNSSTPDSSISKNEFAVNSEYLEELGRLQISKLVPKSENNKSVPTGNPQSEGELDKILEGQDSNDVDLSKDESLEQESFNQEGERTQEIKSDSSADSKNETSPDVKPIQQNVESIWACNYELEIQKNSDRLSDLKKVLKTLRDMRMILATACSRNRDQNSNSPSQAALPGCEINKELCVKERSKISSGVFEESGSEISGERIKNDVRTYLTETSNSGITQELNYSEMKEPSWDRTCPAIPYQEETPQKPGILYSTMRQIFQKVRAEDKQKFQEVVAIFGELEECYAQDTTGVKTILSRLKYFVSVFEYALK